MAVEPPITVGTLVQAFGGQLHGPAERVLRSVATLQDAGPAELSFLANSRYRAHLPATRAGAVAVTPDELVRVPQDCAAIVSNNPYAWFARAAQRLVGAQQPRVAPSRDPSARIDVGAHLAGDVSVGAHCSIGDGCVIEHGVTIGAGCIIERGVKIGAGSRLMAHVTVYPDCSIGQRALIHAGVVIGADGFGFAPEQGRWIKVPQIGRVLIGDDVEIGANTTIDRGTLGDTIIGNGCKLDNQIQIAHNVELGEHCAIAAMAGIAGSAKIGAHVQIGGAAGIAGHLQICDHAIISAMSMVGRSIRQPGFYSGIFPLMSNRQWERSAAVLRHLDELRDRVRQLETQLKDRG